MDLCVLVIATYEKSLDSILTKKYLATEGVLSNFVDHYTVAVKNNSNDDHGSLKI